MQRIDVATSSRELFGSDRSAVRLAEVLADLGYSVRLAVPAHRPERGLADLARSRGVEVVEAPLAIASSKGLDGARSVLSRRWPAPAPDLVVLNTTAVVLPLTMAADRVLVVREWLEPGKLAHRVLARLLRRRLKHVVGISRDVVRQWQQVSGAPVPTSLVWNWLDDRWLSTAPAGPEREGVICVGRFNAWKGQDTLADAFVLAFAGERPPTLTFVGAETGNAFATAVDAMTERARAAGWTITPATADTRSAMDRAALLVVPSMKPEPFGNVLLEGLAAGCRVMAFEGGGPTDLAPLFDGALTVLPRSVDALAEGLRAWARDGADGQTAEQAEATATVLHERFSRERAREDWRRVLASVTT